MAPGSLRKLRPNMNAIVAYANKDERRFKIALDEDADMIRMMLGDYYRYFYHLPTWELGYSIMDERGMSPEDEYYGTRE